MALIQYVLLIIVISSSILLGAGILLSNVKSRTNLFYFLTSVSIVFWVLFSYLVYYDSLMSYSTLLGRANFAAVALFCASIFGFSRNFPKEKRFSPLEIMFIIWGALLSIASIATSLIVKNVSESANGRYWEFGSLEYLYYVYGIIAAVIVIWTVLSRYKSSTDKGRIQVKFLALGITLMATFNIVFNIVIPIFNPNLNLYWIGDYSLLFILGFTAYAIVKFQLFDIKLIATEITVLLLSVGLLIDAFISNSAGEGVLKAIIWVLATYGGYVLIKSVKNEIKQKEELQGLYKDLKEANKHLKELDETKDNFLSMAAHELNTPISAIEGYLSMIVDEKMCGDLGEQANKYLGNVYNSSKRLAALVKDLLNVSRIESNRIHLIFEEVQFEDMIDECINEIKIKADQQQHELIWNRPQTPLPKTWLDKSRITEVIINLLGNAVKYTEPGGRIEIEAHTDGNKIVFSIQDNGRGIPKDKKIFEKFVQVDVLKDEVKGTGLGMFISKNLVELHGGKIWYTSSTGPEDHGTRFFFSTPILPNKPADQFEGQGAVLQLK